MVQVESQNSWFYVAGDSTYESTFYNSVNFVDRDEQWEDNTNDKLAKINIYISSLKRMHTREVYGFIDILGDLGGVLEVIMVVMSGILMPISEHHFILQAAKRMFMAKSTDP